MNKNKGSLVILKELHFLAPCAANSDLYATTRSDADGIWTSIVL
jgi:hypothetical protein